MHNAGVRDRNFERVLELVSADCNVCKRHKKPVPRPVVALPMADKFNDLVAMDLKSYNNMYFLVMVDYATRYCASELIGDKKPATVVKAIFSKWLSLFGPPKKLLFDNGGEFQNPEMRQLGETFNIKLMATAAESPWSNGVVEKLNGVLARSVKKIVDDVGCDIRTVLAWAVSARNSLDNYAGFSPNQLVFSFNTALPTNFINKPPSFESVHCTLL